MHRRSFDTGRNSGTTDASGRVGWGEGARRLREALREGPVVAVVRGASGTDLSRLVDEVLAEAEFAEWTQLRGACPEVAGVVTPWLGVDARGDAGRPDAGNSTPTGALPRPPTRPANAPFGDPSHLLLVPPVRSVKPVTPVRDGDANAAADAGADTGVATDADAGAAYPPAAGPPEPTPAEPAPAAPLADALAGLPYRPAVPGRVLPQVAGVVGLLVPELADRLPEPPAAAADPVVRRGLLPRAVEALLAGLGDALLVMEDVHRADPATLALLHHLMGAMPPGLRLIVTEDAADGLPVFGVPLAVRTRVEEIDVRPWTCEETQEFVRGWLPAEWPQGTEESLELGLTVHELTGGLPGVAEALLRAAGARLRARAESGPRAVAARSEVRDIGHAGAPTAAHEGWRRGSGAGRAGSDEESTGARFASGDGLDGRWTPASVLAAVQDVGVPPEVRRDFALRCGRLGWGGGGGEVVGVGEDARVGEGVGSGDDACLGGGAPLGGVAPRRADAPLRRATALPADPRLGDIALRVVEVAAVLDRAVSVGVVAEVVGVSVERVEAAVDACVRCGVLRADGPRVVFRHPLDRRAALARVPATRVARLSLRAARALHRGGDGPLPLAALARLYAAAGRVREGVRCLVAAADRAATDGDYSTATSLYTQAVAEDPRAAGRIRTAVKLARTAQLARAGEDVVAAVRRVLDEDAPPPRLRGEIRLHLSVVLRNQSGGALDSLNEVARAIPDLELTDPQTAARAMAVAAIPSIKGWPVARHLHWLDRVQTLAGQVTDPAARAAVAANRATALMLLGDPRAWAAAEALRGPAETAMEAAHHARGWTNLAHAASALGYDVRAQEFLERAAHGLADTTSPYLDGLTQTARLVLAWHGGRWHGLHTAADRTTRLYAEIPDLTAEAMLVRGLVALHVLGDVPRARRDLADAARITRYDTGLILTASAAALARVHLEAGRHGQACEAVEEVLHRLETTGGWVWAGEVAPIAVEALHGSGQTTRAQRLVAGFAAGSEQQDAPAAHTAVIVCRALLAEAEGRPEEAVVLLAEAEQRWRHLGRPFDAARAAEARGRCLLDLHGETAAHVVQDVTETYGALGARWDVARCQRLLRRHDIITTHRRGRLGYGDQLSPREEEVARLVVRGRANREIAESLVLSTRTVEHHVARIMRKLNVTRRTDIAAEG